MRWWRSTPRRIVGRDERAAVAAVDRRRRRRRSTTVAPSATAPSTIPSMRSAERAVDHRTDVGRRDRSDRRARAASARFATRRRPARRRPSRCTTRRDVDVQRWPGGAERAEQRAVDDEVEIGVGEHDHRVLAAELEATRAGGRSPSPPPRRAGRSGTEPVKLTAPRRRGAPRAPRRARRAPWTTWTSAGRHAGRHQRGDERSAHSGACSDGLSTIPLPASSAGKHFHDGIATGKFHGVIIPTTPTGWRVVQAILSGSSDGTTSRPARRGPGRRRSGPCRWLPARRRLPRRAPCRPRGRRARRAAPLRSARTSAARAMTSAARRDRAAGPRALRLGRCADRAVDVGSGCRGERAQHLGRTGRVDRIERRHHLIVSR